jgi:hypothetical protein
MSRGLKILTVALGVVAILFVGTGMLVAATVIQAGMVTLQVQERHGDDFGNFSVAIPAGLLYAGLAIAPSLSEEVEAELDGVRRELDEIGPELAGILADLESCPDAVLLEARRPGEHVRIEKRGDKLNIHVRDAHSNVKISVPAGLMSRLAAAVS